MQKLIVVLAGAGVGIAATALCFLLGLQSGFFKTLATFNLVTSVTAALVGEAAAGRYRRRIKQDSLTRLEVERAIGAIGERYALNPGRQNVLIALEELRGELDGSHR